MSVSPDRGLFEKRNVGVFFLATSREDRMKNAVLVILVMANLGVVVGFGWTLSFSSGHASEGVQLSDLTYGAIDSDGDGRYTFGDDWVVEWLLNNQPSTLDEALQSAVVKGDGGVDISAHLRGFTADSIEAKRPR